MLFEEVSGQILFDTCTEGDERERNILCEFLLIKKRESGAKSKTVWTVADDVVAYFIMQSHFITKASQIAVL
jgi:hypothetical protein